MTTPLALIPTAIAGAAGAAIASRDHEDTEGTIALAGGAAAAALGGALIFTERNYLAGVPLVLVGLATAFLSVRAHR